MRRWRLAPAVLVVMLAATGCGSPKVDVAAVGDAVTHEATWAAQPAVAMPVTTVAMPVTTVAEFPLTIAANGPEAVANVLTTDPEQIEEILTEAAAAPLAEFPTEAATDAGAPQPVLPVEPSFSDGSAELAIVDGSAELAIVDGGAELAIVDGSGQAATAPVEADESFQSIAVTWPMSDDAPQLQVRVRDESGEWGPWVPLEDDDAYPDAGTQDMSGVRAGTDTVFVGEADAFQIATVGTIADAIPADDVRIATISTPEDGFASAGVIVDAAYHPGTYPENGAADIQFIAAVTAPRVYTRSEWGAKARQCSWPSADTLKGAIVHHTAGSNSYSTQSAAMQQIRNDQAYHMDSRGWCDLGYNFVVDKWGNVYEGATGSLSSAVIGAHTGGFNTSTVGISMLGNYDAISAPSVVIDAVGRLAAWRLNAYGVSPTGTMTLSAGSGNTMGWATGSSHTVQRIAAHRDLGNTDCPGAQGYRQMDAIRSAAVKAVGTTPTPTPTIQLPTITPTPAPSTTKPPTVTVNVPAAQTSVQNRAITALTVPVASVSTGAAATYAATGQPTGITFNATTRTFTGTPTKSGTYTVTVSATAGGVKASKSFTWTVTAPVTVTVNVPGTQNSMVGKAISTLTLPAATASNGSAVTYQVSGQPTGVAFNGSTRTFTGTPTTAGTYTVAVRATAGGTTATKTFTWIVAKPTLTVNVPSTQNSTRNKKINDLVVRAASVNNGSTITYRAANVPPGLAFNTSTRTFSGTPTTAGTYTVTITATATGVSGAKTFTWKVA